jgi:DNA-binding transcriptional LysR family regulator
MNIQHLETFVIVADCGSISAAARQLDLTHSAISQKMKSLEQDLNCSLFVRHSQGIELSPVGELIYQRAKFLLSQTRALKLLVENFHELESGSLQVSVSSPCMRIFFLDFLQQFQKKYSGIHFNLKNYPPKQALLALLAQQIDAAFLPLDQVEELLRHDLKHTQYHIYPLLKVFYRFLCHVRHPLWYFDRRLREDGKFLLPFHLKNHQIAILDESTFLRKHFEVLMESYSTHYRFDLDLPDLFSLEKFLRPPFLYLGLVPSFDLKALEVDPTLKEVKVSSLNLTRKFALVSTRSEKALSPLMTKFFQMMKLFSEENNFQ